MDAHTLELVELWLRCALLLAALKAVKYTGWPRATRLNLDDCWLLMLGVLLWRAPAWLGHPLATGLGITLGTMCFTALWLDVLLFRIFTIELGPGGVGTVVVAQLYKELTQIAHARHFFAAHRAFMGLPLAAAVVLLPTRGATHTVLSACVLAYTAWLMGPSPAAQRWALWFALVAARALLSWGPPLPWTWPVVTAAVFLGCASLLKKGRPASLIRDFILARPLPLPGGFQPRPEHAHLCISPIRSAPPPSRHHGLLNGSSVILITVESMGRDHLAQAHMPFLKRLKEQAVWSLNHCCISPTTNNAHIALYAGDYASSGNGVGNLVGRGYQAVYVTADDTHHYGLKPILQAAGIQHMVDRLPHDPALLELAVPRIAALRRPDAPLFLHVHTTATHVPYRVVDRGRFNRFDHHSDHGRFLNGLEETDWVLERLVDMLTTTHAVTDPLIIVTGDHGQSFGNHGYHSHGSSVLADQLTVPLMMHHPKLSPESLEHSSHFDVLPTVVDLLGVEGAPSLGQSLFLPRPTRSLFVHAGHPSRTSTSNFGLLHEDQKYMLELVTGRCYQMGWNDENMRELQGAEGAYMRALLSRCLQVRGLM